jgi:outer membrane protein assembly factor BamB
MGVRKRIRKFRDWCPQPPDRLPTKLKRYSIPIAAVVTATLILSVSLFVFSSSLMPSAPIVPLVNAPVSATPTLLWKYTTSAMEEVYGASPVVVNGVVYTSEENNYVYALNATDGTQLWDYFTGEWPSSPAVANGVVYVNTDFSINALNATDGTQIWSNEPQYDVPVGFSSPTVADGVVYAGTTNSLDKSEGNVYAMNATNGKTLWSTPSLAAGFATVPSSPTVANGVVYIGDEGAFGWSIPPNTPITQICYGVYALNATSGAQLWNYNIGYSSGASPVVVGGVVYYVPEEDKLFALNATSGAEIWNYSAPMGNRSQGNLYNVNVDSSPAVVDGIVYLGSDEGNLYAFNAASGAILWNYTIGNGTLSTPTVADGVMYIGSSDGNIYALNATNGIKLWSHTTSGAVFSPAIVNGVLYAGASNNIYALRVSPASSPPPKAA